MQVIAAHNRLPKRALFFHIATNPERQSWLLWLFTATLETQTPSIFHLSHPQRLAFFFMVAKSLLHLQALHLSSREQKGGEVLEAKAPSSMSPFIIGAGSPFLRSTPNISLSWGTPRSRTPGKDTLFWLHMWMPQAKAGFLCKEEKNRYGQERKNQVSGTTISEGQVNRLCLLKQVEVFPLEKLLFTLLFPIILTQHFEKVGPLSLLDALKDIFLVCFFSLRNEKQEEGKGLPLPWTDLSRAHIPPATNKGGRPGEPFELGTGMEDGQRINYAISQAWSQTSHHAPN